MIDIDILTTLLKDLGYLDDPDDEEHEYTEDKSIQKHDKKEDDRHE